MAVRPPLRTLRALLFTVVCVTMTLAAHASVSHAPVPAYAVALSGLGAYGLAWILAGHERSPATILAGLLLGQFALHTLYAAAQPDVTHAAHEHAPVAQVSAAPYDPGMSLAHLAVALVLGWWLWRGERAVWSLARRLAALLPPVLAPPALPVGEPERRPGPAVHAPAALICALLRHSLATRAPPFRSPAAARAL